MRKPSQYAGSMLNPHLTVILTFLVTRESLECSYFTGEECPLGRDSRIPFKCAKESDGWGWQKFRREERRTMDDVDKGLHSSVARRLVYERNGVGWT
jgi:hypothetical protein